MRTLYLECNMGAAGDMLMAALYELLDDQEGFLHTMNGLLPGVHLTAQPIKTCGIAGTHMQVTVHGEEEHEPDGSEHQHDHAHEHHHEHGHAHEHTHEHTHEQVHAHEHTHDHAHAHHHHATPGHIAGLIDRLALPQEVRQRARAVYDAIALAEAKAHGCPVGDVHYHEVGALDAVADVTGVCYAMHLLGVQRVVVSPVHVGCGTVRCAHGIMPVPAPATANLLAGVPVYGGSVQGELCTPTGAALLVQFADSFGPMPVMCTEGVGIGIGTKQFEQANCVRAFLGETGTQANGAITELVCNLDDMTPEALAFACEQLLEAGALDVYTTPATLKKGRAGQELTVLCDPAQETELAARVLALTSTNGLRVRQCGKYFLEPAALTVSTAWGQVRVKRAQGFGTVHVKPEYADAAAAARAHGLSYGTVEQEVRRILAQDD